MTRTSSAAAPAPPVGARADHVAAGSGVAAPSARRLLGARTVLLLFFAALAVRTVYCLVVLRHYVPASDASDYYKIAVSVADGHGLATTFPFGYVHPTAFRAPLFPLLLGAVFAVTGPSLAVAQVVNVLLGSTVVVLIAVLAARIGGRRAGLLAGGLAAVYPPLLANDGPPLTEALALALLLAGLLALARPASRRTVVLAGAAIGLLVLTRTSAQLLVPLLALWLPHVIGWRRTALFVATAAVIVLPWVARNQIEFGKPVVVTSNGFDLAATWSEVSLAQGKPADPVYDPRFAFLRTGSARYNEADLDANFRREGLRGLRGNPDEIPGVIWRNTRFLLDLHLDRENGAERFDGRNLTLRFYTLPVTWLVMVLGTLGLARLWRHEGARWRRRDGRLLVLCAGYFLVVSVVAVSPPRLRAPLDALFLVGASTLVLAWVERLRRKPARLRRRQRGAPGAP